MNGTRMQKNYKLKYKTMRLTKLIAVVFSTVLIAGSAMSQPKIDLRPNETVLLYTDSFEGNTDLVYGEIKYAGYKMEEDNELTGPERLYDNGNLSNTSSLVRFDLYFPKKPNGQMVIVCPGGGYEITSTYNEGLYVAEWMLKKGITVAVVKYRMPNQHSKVPATDVWNTFRYCRKNATKWNVSQIGVMGFSAGGHLAATVSTMWPDTETRPDFSILIYPVITMEVGVTHKGTREKLIGKKAIWDKQKGEKYSLDNQITRFTPPTFIAHCTDDTVVPIENALRYYKKLVDNEVDAEMHIWPRGGHGWGFTRQEYRDSGKDPFGYGRKDFESLLALWLDSLAK